MKTGDYYKLVGDYTGVVWFRRRWVRFECESCVRQLGIAKNRLQGPMTDKANHACQFSPVIYRHDVQTHKSYIAASKAKIIS